MPIQLGKKTYKNFAGAVRAIMAAKHLTRAHASAYVAAVEDRQSPGWRMRRARAPR